MGYRVSAARAAFIVRRHERIVRTHLAKGDLPAEKVGGTWQIDVDDLARVPGWHVDAARLAELQAQDERGMSAILARLEALERENRDIRARLRTLERLSTGSSISAGVTSTAGDLPSVAVEARQPSLDATGAESRLDTPRPAYDLLGASGDAYGVSRDAYSAYQPRRASPTLRLGPSLPDGLVSAARFAAMHGIRESTMKKGIMSGRLRAQEGHWKAGRAWITYALDADGRRQFYAEWGDLDSFKRCPDCPH